MLFEKIVKQLIKNKKTISTMESCTGGKVADEITNIEGASEIFKFSAVTYSNEFKIKMGVKKEIIDKYSVYSMETANEMSKKISDYTNSDYGVGITGKLNRYDPANDAGKDNVVFISIYDKNNNSYKNKELEVTKKSRKENKKLVIETIVELLEEIIRD